jgi:hypothetical protein
MCRRNPTRCGGTKYRCAAGQADRISHRGGFDIALTGISEDELSKLSVGVDELEQMPELPDGDRSPFRDMTFILYGAQFGIVERAIARATKPRDPDNPNLAIDELGLR